MSCPKTWMKPPNREHYGSLSPNLGEVGRDTQKRLICDENHRNTAKGQLTSKHLQQQDCSPWKKGRGCSVLVLRTGRVILTESLHAIVDADRPLSSSFL